jgi:protein SCO1/2
MAHTSSIFLIDRAGRLRAMMPFGHAAPDFVHDIELLLAT